MSLQSTSASSAARSWQAASLGQTLAWHLRRWFGRVLPRTA